MDDLHAWADEKENPSLNQEGIDAAGSALIKSGEHAQGWEDFTFKRMLPERMAAALERLTVDLSTDALVATLAFLTGLTGLLKIGTYVQSQVGHRVPMNLFFAILARTGKLKTPIFKRLVKHPAMELIKENRAQYMRDLKDYQEACKQAKKDKEPEPDPPQRSVIHASDWNAPLARMLMTHCEKSLGILLNRDELLASSRPQCRHSARHWYSGAQFLSVSMAGSSLRVGEGCVSLMHVMSRCTETSSRKNLLS